MQYPPFPPVTSSLLGPNILLNTMFSYTLNFLSSRSVSDQVSHPYKTTGKIIVLCILIFKFLDPLKEKSVPAKPNVKKAFLVERLQLAEANPDCELSILSKFNVSRVKKYAYNMSAFCTIARDCNIFRDVKENCQERSDVHCYAAKFKSSFALFFRLQVMYFSIPPKLISLFFPMLLHPSPSLFSLLVQ